MQLIYTSPARALDRVVGPVLSMLEVLQKLRYSGTPRTHVQLLSSHLGMSMRQLKKTFGHQGQHRLFMLQIRGLSHMGFANRSSSAPTTYLMDNPE